jgi:hypothetical protein
MSGGAVKNLVFQVDGSTYDIPEDRADAFLDSMARKGKQVRAIDDEDDVPQAPVPTSQPQERDEPDPPTQTSDAPRDAISTLADIFREQEQRKSDTEDLRGQGAGAILGGLAEGYTLGAAKPMRAEQDEAPGVSALARLAGTLGNPLGALTSGVGSAWTGLGGWLGRAGVQGASGAAQSGIQAYNEGDPNDPERGAKAVRAGEIGGAVGAGVSALGAPIAAAGQRLYDKARLAAVKLPPRALEQFADKRGLDVGAPAARQLVSEVEAASPPNLLVPRDAGAIRSQIRPELAGQNAAINGALGRAQAAGAQLPPNLNQQIAGDLRTQAFGAEGANAGANAGAANPLRAVAGQVDAANPVQTVGGVRAAKTAYYDQAYPDAPGGTPESFMGQANKAAGDAYGGVLRDFVGQPGNPAIEQQFDNANRAYEALSTYGGPARQQSFRNAVGAGMNNGEGNSIWSMLGRAVTNIPGMDYVPDLAGNAIRPVVGTASWLSQNAGTAAAGGGDVAQTLMGRGQQPRPQQGSDNARPFDAVKDPQRIDAMLHNPQTAMQLSQWKDALTAAANSDDEARWEAGIEKLYRSDDEFRALFMQGGR